MEKRIIRGISLLTLASLIWGTAFVAQSKGAALIGPFAFNGARFLIGGLMLLPLLLVKARGRQVQSVPVEDARQRRKALWMSGVICGSLIFLSATFQQIGIALTSVGKAGFIISLYIVIVPIIGLFLGKKAAVSVWMGIALAAVGMYFLCMTGDFLFGKGDALFLVCAVCVAVHILVIDHFLPKVDGVQLSCLQFLVCGGVSLGLSLAAEQTDTASLGSAAGPILYTGIFSSGIAFTCQTLGQKDIKPVLTSLILSLESVFAVLSGWVLLGEILSPREVLGCVLIFVAILLAQLPELMGRSEETVI